MSHTNSLPTVYELIASSGPHRCHCGAALSHPGACDECAAKWDRAELSKILRPAMESIPLDFREDVKLLAPELVAKIARRIPRPLPKCVAIVGPAGSGKTTTACVYLDHVHRQAVPGADPGLVDRGQRAFFVSAIALEAQAAEDRQGRDREGRTMDLMRRALRASVLVLDNVEPGDAKSAACTVVMERFNSRLPTIVTTWMSEPEAARYYGGGWARRVYSATVELRARAVGS